MIKPFVFAVSASLCLFAAPVMAQNSASSSSSGTPVTVDNYARDYEGPKTDRETAYDAQLKRALVEKTVRAGALEGSWVVMGNSGTPILSLELRTDNARKVEGAWRFLMTGDVRQSGLLSDVTLYENKLSVYFYGAEKQPVTLSLKHYSDDTWRGSLKFVSGKSENIIMSRAMN
jgi:hypothetical protein